VANVSPGLSKPVPPPVLALEVRVDEAAAPGNVVVALAALLLQRARGQVTAAAKTAGDRPGHRRGGKQA
jgi:hypothetical protein